MSPDATSLTIRVADRDPLRLGDVVRVIGSGPGPAAAFAARVDVRFEKADVERTSCADGPESLARIDAEHAKRPFNKSRNRNAACQWEELPSER